MLYNLARSEQLTGHDLEALEHFRQFVRLSATDAKITDAMREKAKANVEELSRKVGQIELDAPSTARVTVDGKPVDPPPPGATRDPIPVAPGKHVVEATFEGTLKSVTVECTAGNVVRTKIEFESGFTEPPGGGERHTPTGKWLVPTVLGVVGLAGLGVGIGMAASSQSAKDDSEAMRVATPGLCASNGGNAAACAQYDAKRSDAESAATVSYVGYIAGATLLTAAVVTYFVWPKSSERTSTRSVTPRVGLGSVGLEGRF